MKYRTNLFADRISKAFLTCCGAGLSPIAPGTVGSLVTLPILFLLAYLQAPIVVVIISTILLTGIAILLVQRIQLKEKIHDPSWIVIDELLGMITTWLFYPSQELLNLFIIFVLFRFFDILKPWPISYIDKNMRSGFGVILDDIAAGIMAGIWYYLIVKFQLIAQ